MGKQVLENKVSLLRHKEYSDHDLVSVKSGESLYILIIVRSDYSMFNATVSVIYCESFHLKNKSWRQKWTGGKSFTVTYEFLFLSFKELEQLASVLSVVNAPIQATVQVIMLIYSGIWYLLWVQNPVLLAKISIYTDDPKSNMKHFSESTEWMKIKQNVVETWTNYNCAVTWLSESAIQSHYATRLAS